MYFRKIEGITYATSLDLNMGNYTLSLDPDAKNICTIITPWENYQYLCLPMCVKLFIIKNVKETIPLNIPIQRGFGFILRAFFVDSNHTGIEKTHRSRTGLIIYCHERTL